MGLLYQGIELHQVFFEVLLTCCLQYTPWGMTTSYEKPVYCVVCCHPTNSGRQTVDAPAGVTQEEGHTGFLHLPYAVLALIFIARRIQPSLSLVDREVELCVPTNKSFSIWLASYFLFFVKKNPRSCDYTEIRTHDPTPEGFEVTN